MMDKYFWCIIVSFDNTYKLTSFLFFFLSSSWYDIWSFHLGSVLVFCMHYLICNVLGLAVSSCDAFFKWNLGFWNRDSCLSSWVPAVRTLMGKVGGKKKKLSSWDGYFSVSSMVANHAMNGLIMPSSSPFTTNQTRGSCQQWMKEKLTVSVHVKQLRILKTYYETRYH